MRNIQAKFVERIIYIYIYVYIPEYRTVSEIKWKNTVQSDRPQMTIWRMRFASWLPEATNTHSLYLILIAFSTTPIVR